MVRSVVFNALFYLNLAVYLVAAMFTLPLPYRYVLTVARAWAMTNLWLLRVICGIKADFRGLEKMPRGGHIVASKHQ